MLGGKTSCSKGINFIRMKIKLFILIVLLNIFLKVTAQNLQKELNKNAVKIEPLDSLNSQVFNLLSKYQVIMIGEMHGTNESANLVLGLSKLFTKLDDSVQVGFEIPSKQMLTFIKQHTDSSILYSDFFARPSGDGRASNAWYNVISNINNNHKASIFFFDTNLSYGDNRDSLMYLNIKSKLIEHPNWKTITISGNVHNGRLPFNNKNTAASFLVQDTDLNITDKLCSLNHEFESGSTLWNDFMPINSVFSKVNFDNYLFLYSNNKSNNYNGIYFTRRLTKSESVISK
ncbi:MAG: hypothetical protein NTU43_00170 [Bacteroidetes bacterium]|nr:hypothetical protein [Bacteroidota bacterium]